MTEQQQPGALRSAVTMTIQTRHAQSLITGRASGRDAIVGLHQFASAVRRIVAAASLDDPYADWWLLRITAALDEAREGIARMKAEGLAILARYPAIQVDISESLAPITVPLVFSTPHAYAGAYLVADFDEYMRIVATLRHVALLTSKQGTELRHESARLVRRVFHLSRDFVYFGITREDVRQATAKAIEAEARMGELPEEVLNQQKADALAPPKREQSAAEAQATADMLDRFSVRAREARLRRRAGASSARSTEVSASE